MFINLLCHNLVPNMDIAFRLNLFRCLRFRTKHYFLLYSILLRVGCIHEGEIQPHNYKPETLKDLRVSCHKQPSASPVPPGCCQQLSSAAAVAVLSVHLECLPTCNRDKANIMNYIMT